MKSEKDIREAYQNALNNLERAEKDMTAAQTEKEKAYARARYEKLLLQKKLLLWVLN